MIEVISYYLPYHLSLVKCATINRWHNNSFEFFCPEIAHCILKMYVERKGKKEQNIKMWRTREGRAWFSWRGKWRDWSTRIKCWNATVRNMRVWIRIEINTPTFNREICSLLRTPYIYIYIALTPTRTIPPSSGS